MIHVESGGGPAPLHVETPRERERVRLVHVDGMEPRRTCRDALRHAGLEEGTETTAEELLESLAAAEPPAAIERALRFLGHRERSIRELADRLSVDGFPEEVVCSVIDRLSGWGYLDDRRFAEHYAVSKRGSGWGRRRIERALQQAGVDDETAREVLATALPPADEIERAASLLKRPCGGDQRERERQIRRLVNRGYTYDVARAAVGKHMEGSESC